MKIINGKKIKCIVAAKTSDANPAKSESNINGVEASVEEKRKSAALSGVKSSNETEKMAAKNNGVMASGENRNQRQYPEN
jgi:hypothetical protein